MSGTEPINNRKTSSSNASFRAPTLASTAKRATQGTASPVAAAQPQTDKASETATPPSASTTTPLRFGSFNDAAPDYDTYGYGVPNAPARSSDAYRSSRSLQNHNQADLPPTVRVGIPPRVASPTPSIPRAPAAAPASSPSGEPAMKTDAAADDSGETVRPAPTHPAASAQDELLRLYTEELHPVDLDEQPRFDLNGKETGPSMVVTIAQKVALVRHLHTKPSAEYLKRVGSQWVLTVGVLGQLESVLEDLSNLLGMLYVKFGLRDEDRDIDLDFHLPLVALINRTFARYGLALRALNWCSQWIDYAAAWLEHMLGMREAGPDFPLCPEGSTEEMVELKGYYNNFAESTFYAGRSSAAQDDSRTSSWTAKDTLAMTKSRAPMPSAFAKNQQSRRATYAVNPVDFTIPGDKWLDGLATPRYSRGHDPLPQNSVTPGANSPRIGAGAARAAERPPHFDKTLPTMLRGEVAAPATGRTYERSPTRSPNPFRTPKRPPGGPPDGDDDPGDGGGGRGPPGFPGPYDDPDAGGQPPDGPYGGGGGDPYDDGGGGPPDGGDPAAYGGYYQGAVPRVPTFDMRFKMDMVPPWDGQDATAVEYFGKLAGLCRIGGEIPALLPRVAPNHFTGRAATWWRNLSDGRRAAFQRDFFAFVHGIREYLLSDRWTEKLREAYTLMRFQQRGFADESPFDFIARRAYLCRFLFAVTPREMVAHVMANAPRAWHYVIGGHNIPDVDELMRRASTLHDELLSAHQASYGLPEAKIEEMVRRALKNGVARPASNNPYNNQRTFGYAKAPPAIGAAVHLVDTDEHGMPDSDLTPSLDDYALAAANLAGQDGSSPPVLMPPPAHEAVMHSVYAFLATKSKQRPPPKGGYLFPKSSHASPKMPPSPCKVCGGEKHWDRECPHWGAYEARRKQGVLVADAERPLDEEGMYESVYTVYVNEMLSRLSSSRDSTLLDLLPTPSNLARRPIVDDVEDEYTKWYRGVDKLPASAAAILDDQERPVGAPTLAEESTILKPPPIPRVSIEEVEDEEQAAYARAPKALTGAILEPAHAADDDWQFDLEPVVFTQALTAGMRGEAGPPEPDRVVRVPARRLPPPGQSSRGISILSCRGRLGSIQNRGVTLRLDSGASISLVAKEYLQTLTNPPKIRKGLKVQIAQLTNSDPSIEGYVNVPVYIKSADDCWLEFATEMYVVPSMTVDVLLGEDWHVNYGLDVLRSLEGGTRVNVSSIHDSFVATSLAQDTSRAERADALVGRSFKVVHPAAASFVKAKSHRRARAARQRRKRALSDGAVRAYRDVVLPPESTVFVEVAGELSRGRDWLVERNLVQCGKDCFLTVPNTLLSTDTSLLPDANGGPSFARKARLPVSNPTKLPRILRAGTLLGHAKDPALYLDKPGTEERLQEMQEQAKALAALAQGLAPHEATGSAAAAFVANDSPELDPPAAAEAPNPTIFPSVDLEKILDISSDVPPDVRAKAVSLFKRHVKAFGFDGRLGHLATNARIRTKEGVEPISEPLRGASPEKKQVIEDQLKKWFELGVIEDSSSPWAAPVVIVYRNGKARFCVDYRKLNAATIPDGFPIPRQNDILSALSGSQVLSSLDALAGFTQLEMAPEDVEKTAFRTHKGLYQFLRMPFGLRNGPAIFQRVMQGILAPFLWIFTLVYIDDIVVYSPSYEEHLDHLDKVLGAIERAGLTLSPDKCHFLYSSILLLGHKVSRLGLSTHKEKVEAIAALEPPRKVATLQTFLGMVVYFQSFIPYYSFIVAPLFKLLRKDCPWEWGAEQQHAFEQAKLALQLAPVLAHPIRGLPYRLYTDASDEALGACLQQVQRIRVGDLVGTPVYERLKRAHTAGEPVPQLCSKLPSRVSDTPPPGEWGASLDETVVHVERVVAYWSRTFKNAERNYSATEREALAAKDALIKFQPFVEGEHVVLITDHGALQWARTFENTNRRLAAWGAVFAAYDLEIVHRAGRLHSNVDPLSRLPRDYDTDEVRGPPDFIAPARDSTPSIQTNVDAAELLERLAGTAPAPRMTGVTLLAADLTDLGQPAQALALTRRQKRLAEQRARDEAPGSDEPTPVPNPREPEPPKAPSQAEREGDGEDAEMPFHPRLSYGEPGVRPDAGVKRLRFEDQLDWKAANPPPTLLVSMSEEVKTRFARAYESDPAFKGKGLNSDERSWYAGHRFYKGKDGLLFFRDADFMPRLCVPRSERAMLLRQAHESTYESAHAGAEKLHAKLSQHFYWPRMKVDAEEYCASCDVCQKNKSETMKKVGLLQPHDIPDRPYSRISLDLITGLPWSGLYNAILVVVDLLTKHAQFIPTDTGLDTPGFAALFVRHVVSRFGLPLELIADRDGRWVSRFFGEVTRQMGVHLLLSSAHHPQHDGQTERTNRTLETMLRHYVQSDHQDWDRWLPSLEFAYNSTVHSSTGLSPYHALYGYQPRTPTDLFVPQAGKPIPREFTAHRGADEFLLAMHNHRQTARDAIAVAQHHQAQHYNKRRREKVYKPDELVLIKPHSLELVESKGEGAKLVQRAFGPFAIQERVSDATYRVDLPADFPMSNVIHATHLRPYTASADSWGPRAKLPVPRWNANAVEEYAVEKIVAHRRNRSKKQLEYLVRWESFGPEHDSWLTAHQLRNAPARLLDYRRAHDL